MYDKGEIFVKQKQVKKAPTDGVRYFEAFGELKNFGIFIILTLLLVQQHQHFAKQMTIGGLLTFAYCTVELRMPKEVNQDENIVIQMVNALPFMNHLCYFEISYILKTVIYPSFFNTTLNISRLIDVEPLIEFKKKMLEA
mmetsp:Transcript_18244/g.24376  ORF Transcript_18244/g.24376 Transcript_18244/m.24376 type:complete len:140 (+) Transcript_18244:446-865(+)